MRTTVHLDERLVRRATAATGAKTKKELLHRGLKELVRRDDAERLIRLFGQPLLAMTPRQLLAWRKRG